MHWMVRPVLLGGCITIVCGISAQEHLTVFVHGTLISSANVAAPLSWLRDYVCGTSWPSSWRARPRDDALLRHHQLTGQEGFHRIRPVRPCYLTTTHAQPYIVGAYHALEMHFDPLTQHTYAIFGWNGDLLQASRRAAARELYTMLTRYTQRCARRDGVPPHLTLVAHSHGGNVMLAMASCYGKEGPAFSVDETYLYGTPMLGESRAGVCSSMFRSIVNLYGGGDFVQVADVFSGDGPAHRRLVDIADVADMPHQCARSDRELCLRSRYGLYTSRFTSHMSMWVACEGHSDRFGCDPLPLMVTTPVYRTLFADNPAGYTCGKLVYTDTRTGDIQDYCQKDASGAMHPRRMYYACVPGSLYKDELDSWRHLARKKRGGFLIHYLSFFLHAVYDRCMEWFGCI